VANQFRNATFRDAQAIDRMIEAMPPLLRDLHSWVNQADFHVALVDGDEVVGFGARTKHKAHPQRDLAAVYAHARTDVDALYDAVRGRKPIKVRLPADDADGLAIARDRGFTERIRSATYRVDAAAFAEVAMPYELAPVFDATRELHDAIAVLYADTHRWDPPAPYPRRYVRQAMLAGAQHMAFVRDDADGRGRCVARRSARTVAPRRRADHARAAGTPGGALPVRARAAVVRDRHRNGNEHRTRGGRHPAGRGARRSRGADERLNGYGFGRDQRSLA
jgi:hypothetical protein